MATKAGEAYSWGSGKYGRLGHGNELDQFNALKVAAFEGRQVVSIAAGEVHSIFAMHNGVATCGGGANGCLGLGESDDGAEKIDWHNGNIFWPTPIPELEHSSIVQVEAGLCHSVLRTNLEQVWTFGLGTHGQLGHGDFNNRSSPMKIEGMLKELGAEVGILMYFRGLVDFGSSSNQMIAFSFLSVLLLTGEVDSRWLLPHPADTARWKPSHFWGGAHREVGAW
jgi:alpha-tubulin suppressor-like RCC1 family protein